MFSYQKSFPDYKNMKMFESNTCSLLKLDKNTEKLEEYDATHLLYGIVGVFLHSLFFFTAQGLSCGTRALEHAGFHSCHVQASLLHGMWDLSSPSRDQTRIPCFGRQILNQWATRDSSS